MITGLIIGLVGGAVGMYLIARNSPEHFLKFKNFADAAAVKVQAQVDKIKG
jgi:hypothetical protein